MKNLNFGFTLLELLIVLSIVGVLLVAAVPTISNVIDGNKVSAESRKMMSTIAFSRSEAVKRNTFVTVCKSSNASSCETGTDADWHDGWLVFADINNDGALDSGEEVVKRINSTSAGVVINAGSTIANRFTYRPAGSISNAGSFVVCPQSGDITLAAKIVISIVGRPRQASAVDGDC
jgi:type IV fimbrial biogenesis protein FimT